MIKKLRNNIRGVSLAEVLVSTLIFSVAVVGTFTALRATRQEGGVSDRDIIAAHLGKQILEELRSKVNQDIWDGSFPLTCSPAPGTTQSWTGTLPAELSNFNGDVQITCTNIAIGGNPKALRKITLNITWTE